jgi:hypothetical protein
MKAERIFAIFVSTLLVALVRQNYVRQQSPASMESSAPSAAGPSAAAPVGPVAAAASFAPAPPPAHPELASPGVYYLLTSAHIETKNGIIGLPPGTEVTQVRPGIYKTPAGTLHLDQMQLTNDLGRARTALAYDRNAQAALHVKVIAVDTLVHHGIRKIPTQLNGNLTRYFVVDSGASIVCVPSEMVAELAQSGALTESDYLPGAAIITIADGSRTKRRRFVLRSIKVGEITVPDVVAMDGGPNAMPLLGMSFLTKAGAVYDTANGKLLFNR